MTPAADRGLSPSRSVLDNSVVVIAKRSPTTPAVTVHASFRAGTICDSPRQARAGSLRIPHHRSWHGDTHGGSDCRRPGQSWRVAFDHGEPPRTGAGMHMSCRRSLSDPCPDRGHGHARHVSRARSRDEAQRDRHAHPAGRGQPRRRGERGLVRGPPMARSIRTGGARAAQSTVWRRSIVRRCCGFIVSGSGPVRSRSSWSVTSPPTGRPTRLSGRSADGARRRQTRCRLRRRRPTRSASCASCR